MVAGSSQNTEESLGGRVGTNLNTYTRQHCIKEYRFLRIVLIKIQWQLYIPFEAKQSPEGSRYDLSLP